MAAIKRLLLPLTKKEVVRGKNELIQWGLMAGYLVGISSYEQALRKE